MSVASPSSSPDPTVFDAVAPGAPPTDPSRPVDLADEALYVHGRPEPIWAQLRREAPVYRNRRSGRDDFWAVLTHDLTVEVLRDSAVYTSGNGMRLDADPGAVRTAAAGRMLIVTDPPDHARIKRVVTAAFTPRAISRVEDNLVEHCRIELGRAVEAGTVELTELAGRLAASVICDMLGVPRSDWDMMIGLTVAAWGSSEDATHLARAEAHSTIFLYFEELLQRRRQNPVDDIVSGLAQARVDDTALTDDEILLNLDGILSGGNETTRHAAVGGVIALIERPDQWNLLQQEPDLLPSAVAEVLRFTSPLMHVARRTSRATQLGGVPLATGDTVAVWLPSANRDDAIFPDGDTFDIRRPRVSSLTFGVGRHRCFGAPLATAELTAFFAELLRRTERVELLEPARRAASNLVWGFERARVRLVPRG